MLADFLPRFNERFRVQAQQEDAAYRPLDPDVCLDRIFCLKHWRKVGRDNTLKYRWHTLQLLPDAERGSYAGAKVEVLEGLDRTLRVQHEGRIIPSQEAPPRPGLLRSLNGGAPQAPDENGWKDKYAQLAATSRPFTGPMDRGIQSTCCAGNPIGDKGRGGRRSIAPSFRECPPEVSQEIWE